MAAFPGDDAYAQFVDSIIVDLYRDHFPDVADHLADLWANGDEGDFPFGCAEMLHYVRTGELGEWECTPREWGGE